MMVDRGVCPTCLVMFASKTTLFDLKGARCPYCRTALKSVSFKSTSSIRWINPPSIVVAKQKGRKSVDLKASESVFGKIPNTDSGSWKYK